MSCKVYTSRDIEKEDNSSLTANTKGHKYLRKIIRQRERERGREKVGESFTRVESLPLLLQYRKMYFYCIANPRKFVLFRFDGIVKSSNSSKGQKTAKLLGGSNKDETENWMNFCVRIHKIQHRKNLFLLFCTNPNPILHLQSTEILIQQKRFTKSCENIEQRTRGWMKQRAKRIKVLSSLLLQHFATFCRLNSTQKNFLAFFPFSSF